MLSVSLLAVIRARVVALEAAEAHASVATHWHSEALARRVDLGAR